MIAKAAYLVECAHFVRRCSLGQWPEWMRINMTTFRPQDSFGARSTGNINARLNKLYQAAAARMFYIWGEVSNQIDCLSSHFKDKITEPLLRLFITIKGPVVTN